MALEIELATDIDLEDQSRAFITHDPETTGKVALSTEVRTSTTTRQERLVGHVSVMFSEPTARTIGVELIPTFEEKDPKIFENDDYVRHLIRHSFALIRDGFA